MSEYISPEQKQKLAAARTQADATARAAGGITGKGPYEDARLTAETYSTFWQRVAAAIRGAS